MLIDSSAGTNTKFMGYYFSSFKSKVRMPHFLGIVSISLVTSVDTTLSLSIACSEITSHNDNDGVNNDDAGALFTF